MSKKVRLSCAWLAVVLACVCCMLFASTQTALAASVTGATTDVDLGSGVVAGKTYTLDQEAVKSAAIDKIKKYRLDAYNDTKVRIDGVTIQEVLNRKGIKKDEYINPTWSKDLEYIAIQRAVESGDSSLGETRPNGESFTTATHNGITADAEMRVYSSDSVFGGGDAVEDIAIEKSQYIKKINHEKNYGNTANYETFINPDYKCFAVAVVDGWDKKRVGVVEAGASEASSVSNTGLTGDYNIEISVSNDLINEHGFNFGSSVVALNQKYEIKGTIGYRDNTFTIRKTLWRTYNNDQYLSIDADGNATGKQLGTTTVYVMGQNGARLEKQVTVSNEFKQVHRFYNLKNWEHFYTADESEANYLKTTGKWKYEGVAWTAPVSSSTPVYRLYKASICRHSYTTSTTERDNLLKQGWKDEGIAWYSDVTKGTAITKLYNANMKDTLYTTNEAEINGVLARNKWKLVDTDFYGL